MSKTPEEYETEMMGFIDAALADRDYFADELEKMEALAKDSYLKGIEYAAGYLAANGHYDQSNALLALLKKDG